MKSSEDSAPQHNNCNIFHREKINDEFFFVIEKLKKEERTHIHFITRLEMKLLVVIADSEFGLYKTPRKKNDSNPIFWLNNYLMMIFGLANNGFL